MSALFSFAQQCLYCCGHSREASYRTRGVVGLYTDRFFHVTFVVYDPDLERSRPKVADVSGSRKRSASPPKIWVPKSEKEEKAGGLCDLFNMYNTSPKILQNSENLTLCSTETKCNETRQLPSKKPYKPDSSDPLGQKLERAFNNFVDTSKSLQDWREVEIEKHHSLSIVGEKIKVELGDFYEIRAPPH